MHRNIKLLALHNFFLDLDFLAPVAIIYFTKISGSYALGMSIFSLVFISSTIFEIPTGIFSDLIGRKKTIILSCIARIASGLSLAIGNNYWWLCSAAILVGLARSLNSGNNDALLYESLSETKQIEKYHHFLGKLSSAFQIALAISAILGSFLAAWSFQILLWTNIIPLLFMLITSFFLHDSQMRTRKINTNVFTHLNQALRLFHQNKRLRLLTLVSTIRFSLGESAYVFRSAFVNNLWPLWAVGFSNFLSNIGAAVSYFFSGKLIDRFGAWKILNFEIIFNRFINLVALFFPTLLSPALMGTTSLAYGVGDVALNNLSQKEFSDSERATMGSLRSFIQSLAFGIISFGIGILADFLGPIKTLITIHMLLFIPLWFYKKIFKHEKR